MNGWVTIGTKLDTKQLEKDIRVAENQLKQYEKEGQRLTEKKSNIELDLQEYEKEKQSIQEATDKSLELAETREQVNFVLETEEMQLSKLAEQYSSQFSAISSINKELEENEKNQQIISNQLERQKRELAETIEQSKKAQTLNGIFSNINQTMNNLVKNAIRWGLALFSIRGITGLIRNAMSTLSSENAQIATDIQYMRWILAQTLKPVVEWIISALYLVITLINMITKALFNYDILAGASAKKFKSMQKSSGGVAKNMAEARKQLAGFDEMNILDDNVGSAGGGGAGGGPGMGDWEAPDFTKFEEKLKQLKDKWYKFGEEMRKSLYDMPFEVWTKAFGKWDLAVYGVTQTVHGLWGMVTAFVEFIKGVAEVVKGIITGDTKLIQKGIQDSINAIIRLVKATAETITGISNTVKGVIKGIIQTIWGWLFDYINKGITKFNEMETKITNVWTSIRDKIKNKIKEIHDFLTKNFGEIGTKIGNVLGKGISTVVNAILTFAESKINGFLGSINGAISAINEIPGVSINKISYVHFPRLAKGGIVNVPGRGVMVGNAIAGERGAEGVIPLTDSQQMALLGEAIGRYITVNANITNTMNGRVISRELKTIQNEDDFAFNR